MSKLIIFIAGHKGMVGSALVRLLKRKKVEIIKKEKRIKNLERQINNEFNLIKSYKKS